MSKQADEEQPSIYDILDPVVSEYASNKCWTNGFKSYEEVYEAAMEHLASQLTPNHLIEQRCLETRIEKLERLKLLDDEAVSSAVILPLLTTSGRGIIASWIAESKAQLTNLQNREDE